MAKEAEARAFIADPAPDLAGYPLILAETGITAPDAIGVAQIWLNLSGIWRGKAAALEAVRLSCQAAIDRSTTVADVDAAMFDFSRSVSAA